MSRTKIIYEDTAPGYKNYSGVATERMTESSEGAAIRGVTVPPLLTLEPNRWGLDGTFESYDVSKIGAWGTIQSDTQGALAQTVSYTASWSFQLSSLGVSIIFDDATGELCDEVQIEWYLGATRKDTQTFEPDAPLYFCEHEVENFDRVTVTFVNTAAPRRRAKVNQIIIGAIRVFEMDEVRSAKVTADTNLIALELPINTMSWQLESKKPVDYMFQTKQPVSVMTRNGLLGIFYITRSERRTARLYDIDCHDAFGVLDEYPFAGGVYTAKSASVLAAEIVGGLFPLEVTATDTNVTGAILPCTRREALQQVLFAWGVVATTIAQDGIKIYELDDTLTDVGEGRTYTGPTVTTDALVTEVQVTAHSYTPDANGSVEIGGVKYADTTTVYTVTNPSVTSADKPNVKQVTNGTLVSPAIGQAVAQRVYDYYQRRKTANGRIVWDKELPGDMISIPNAWGTAQAGNITRMDFEISNTIAADTELKGAEV